MDDIEKLIKDAQLQVEQEEKFKEEQRIYEEEKAKEAELIRQAEEIYNPAPTASTNVTPQDALNRTIATVKKVNDKVETKADKSFESIKDISSATTHAEMYALLETGKSYNWKGSILYCFDKQPTQAGVRGFGLTPNKDYAVIGKWIKNTADAISLDIPSDLDRLSVYTPSGDNHATNKKYVDATVDASQTTLTTYVDNKVSGIDLSHKQDTLTKTITLHFDDNTTEDIKVG